MANKYYLLIWSVFLILQSCNKNKDAFSAIEKSKYNILDIEKTRYTYKGRNIYQYNNYMVANEHFPFSNYLIVEGNKAYSIFNFTNLKETDINKFDDLFEIDKGKQYENAADYKYLILDFDLKTVDSLKKDPGNLILKEKFYEAEIKDTVYIFSRKFKWNSPTTNIVSSKKYGIMGVYDYYYVDNKKEIINDYGVTFFDRLDSTYSFTNSFSSRHETLEQIGVHAKKPYLDLSKIKFFSK